MASSRPDAYQASKGIEAAMCDSGDSHIIMQMNIMLLQKLHMIYAKACKSYLDLQIHWRSLPGSNSSGIEVPNR